MVSRIKILRSVKKYCPLGELLWLLTQENLKKTLLKIGAKYALMVNSGSSANLLATFAAGSSKKKSFKEVMKY